MTEYFIDIHQFYDLCIYDQLQIKEDGTKDVNALIYDLLRNCVEKVLFEKEYDVDSEVDRAIMTDNTSDPYSIALNTLKHYKILKPEEDEFNY